ncbi:hypothetical protein ROZALSC1DRAFT_16084 [Rozella allomycis CSF55]|uniref:Fluoride ion transporter CrcB n=1 Tax=Rozella allomycis (strain CSF55) TaxID=988480 RepID=A0A4P9YE87_ROZAC|nr:hypothetical protein ROZALSC1DRAFT_16084 [Rozella allomycis CSF55]
MNIAFEWIYAALIVSPLGAFSRYYLGISCKKCFHKWPVGTWISNFLASMILLYLTYERTSGKHQNSSVECFMILGVSKGFCGSLSTLSTFSMELDRLDFKSSIKYWSMTIVTIWAIYSVTMFLSTEKFTQLSC